MNLDTRLKRFKQEFGMEFTERVQQKTPVRSGHLQKMWGFTIKAKDIEVWNAAPYASFVENGTPEMEPHRMLARTVLEKDEITELAIQRSKK